MEPETVRRFESALQAAIAEVIVDRLGPRWLPFPPTAQTVRMMAKAAVAVYETAVEKYERHGD